MTRLFRGAIVSFAAFVIGYTVVGYLVSATTQVAHVPTAEAGSPPKEADPTSERTNDMESQLREIFSQSHPISSAQIKAIEMAVAGWLQKDPVACLNFLKETGNLGLVNATQIRKSLDMVTNGEPSVALALLSKMPRWNGSDRIYEHYFKEFGTRDPNSALLFAPNVPAHLRKALTQNLVIEWAKRDPVDALRTQSVSALVSNELLSLSIGEAAKVNPSGVRDFLQSSMPPSRASSTERYRFNYLWSLDASEVIRQIKDTATSPQYKNMLNFKLADNFEEMGLENNPNLRDPQLKGTVQRALSIVSQKLAYTDPNRAFQYASKIDGERLRTSTVAIVLETVAKKNLKLAQHLISEISEPATRAIATNRIAEIVANQNPQNPIAKSPKK